MIHSRVSWMFLPVDRSITVSPPQRIAQVIFSTSSWMLEPSAELPMFALIFTRKLRPMIIGSASGWVMLGGGVGRTWGVGARLRPFRPEVVGAIHESPVRGEGNQLACWASARQNSRRDAVSAA